jgi:hypothetical protein
VAARFPDRPRWLVPVPFDRGVPPHQVRPSAAVPRADSAEFREDRARSRWRYYCMSRWHRSCSDRVSRPSRHVSRSDISCEDHRGRPARYKPCLDVGRRSRPRFRPGLFFITKAKDGEVSSDAGCWISDPPIVTRAVSRHIVMMIRALLTSTSALATGSRAPVSSIRSV